MARQYAPRAVLRHIPLDLLRCFISQQDITTGPVWDSLTEGDDNAIYQAWLDLVHGPREHVEQMLRQIHEMANPSAIRAAVAEVLFKKPHSTIATDIETIDGNHAQALWVLLNHGPAFHTARLLFAAACPWGKYWNLTTGFDDNLPDTSQTAIQDLKLAVARLYRTEQGRGQRATAEHFERHGCFYVFLYLDDYTQTHTGHDQRGNLSRQPLRPAFEIVFVYNVEARTLDMFAQGERRWRTELRDLFCEHILHTIAPPQSETSRYQLNPLINRDFPLPVDPANGILSASIRKMRVQERGCPERVGLEANPAAGPGNIYDMLDKHFPIERFPRSNLYVNEVAIHVQYRTQDNEKDRPLTFTVSYPDGCNLKSMSDERRAIGERCLRHWGILNDSTSDGTANPRRAA